MPVGSVKGPTDQGHSVFSRASFAIGVSRGHCASSLASLTVHLHAPSFRVSQREMGPMLLPGAPSVGLFLTPECRSS